MALPVPTLSDTALHTATGNAVPPWAEIPDEIRAGGNPWVVRAERMHSNGWPPDRVGLRVKPEVDADGVRRALASAMRSLVHGYAHKICAVAWMLSEWFDVIDPDAEPEPLPPDAKRPRGRPKGSGRRPGRPKGSGKNSGGKSANKAGGKAKAASKTTTKEGTQ